MTTAPNPAQAAPAKSAVTLVMQTRILPDRAVDAIQARFLGI